MHYRDLFDALVGAHTSADLRDADVRDRVHDTNGTGSHRSEGLR